MSAKLGQYFVTFMRNVSLLITCTFRDTFYVVAILLCIILPLFFMILNFYEFKFNFLQPFNLRQLSLQLTLHTQFTKAILYLIKKQLYIFEFLTINENYKILIHNSSINFLKQFKKKF